MKTLASGSAAHCKVSAETWKATSGYISPRPGTKLQMGSWKYSEGMMALQSKTADIDMGNYIGDHEWAISSSRAGTIKS